ncbi:hypothetical protein JZU68_10555 [bacterium]|jgi:hypothetical protein|nr:hypothetical protein [bacterium]
MDTKQTVEFSEIEAIEQRIKEIELNEFIELKRETETNEFIDLMKSINGGPVDSSLDAVGLKIENKEYDLRFNIKPKAILEYYDFLTDEGVIKSDYLDFANAMIKANFKHIYSSCKAKYKLMKYISLVQKLINDEWYTKAVESIGQTKSKCSTDMKSSDFADKFEIGFKLNKKTPKQH